MEDNWISERAEALPFTRSSMAWVLDVPTRTLNNWIDRHDLWQEGSLEARRGHYRLRSVFDLAGFSAMRIAHIPERECARYVRNHGFYTGFLHGDQLANFSYRSGVWDIGVYDYDAVVSLRINMRTIGNSIFKRISELLEGERAIEEFQSFGMLYRRALELDRLTPGSAPLFEDGSGGQTR